MPDDWESYLRSLAKKFRKELGRSLRLFEAENATRFCRLDDAGQAERVLKVMSEQQRNRLEEKGYAYAFDERSYNGFYASLVARGLKDGTTVLTALMAGEEVVAALLGVSDGTSFAMVRLSHAGGDWLRVGVGRLIIERTMHELHAKAAAISISPSAIILTRPASASSRVRCSISSARGAGGARRSPPETWPRPVSSARSGTIGISLVPKAVKERYRQYRAAD